MTPSLVPILLLEMKQSSERQTSCPPNYYPSNSDHGSATNPQMLAPNAASSLTNTRKTSLQNRSPLEESAQKPEPSKQPRGPCPRKYLNISMPEIHDARASVLFDLVHWDLIVERDSYPEGKLAIVPFGVKYTARTLGNLKDQIFTAVAEITQAQKLGISAPKPNERVISILEVTINICRPAVRILGPNRRLLNMTPSKPPPDNLPCLQPDGRSQVIGVSVFDLL